jgi:hypothetical protein
LFRTTLMMIVAEIRDVQCKVCFLDRKVAAGK